MIGVGTDLVEVDRLRAALDRTPGLADRLFTPAERDHLADRSDALPGLAARFAAKEAVMKALGVGMDRISFTEVEVVVDADGRPGVALSGRAAELAARSGVTRWHLSLTHTASLAQAVAVAE